MTTMILMLKIFGVAVLIASGFTVLVAVGFYLLSDSRTKKKYGCFDLDKYRRGEQQ